MSKDGRKTSKLAIAGLTVAVAAPSLFFICVLVFTSIYKELNGALEIFMLLLLLLPFVALPLSIAGIVVLKTKDRKGLVPGIVGLILSVVETLFVIITFVGYFLFTNTYSIDHSRDSIPMHTGTAAPVETTESHPAPLYGLHSGTKQLTLDDVIELSSKGDELTWEDLEEYKGFETGSGLYIITFVIDDNYSLIVGGTGAVGKPSYAHLTYNDDTYIDIRTEDVEAFIAEHS